MVVPRYLAERARDSLRRLPSIHTKWITKRSEGAISCNLLVQKQVGSLPAIPGTRVPALAALPSGPDQVDGLSMREDQWDHRRGGIGKLASQCNFLPHRSRAVLLFFNNLAMAVQLNSMNLAPTSSISRAKACLSRAGDSRCASLAPNRANWALVGARCRRAGR